MMAMKCVTPGGVVASTLHVFIDRFDKAGQKKQHLYSWKQRDRLCAPSQRASKLAYKQLQSCP